MIKTCKSKHLVASTVKNNSNSLGDHQMDVGISRSQLQGTVIR